MIAAPATASAPVARRLVCTPARASGASAYALGLALAAAVVADGPGPSGSPTYYLAAATICADVLALVVSIAYWGRTARDEYTIATAALIVPTLALLAALATDPETPPVLNVALAVLTTAALVATAVIEAADCSGRRWICDAPEASPTGPASPV